MSSLCPKCGTAIDAESVGLGHCPVCLLKLGLEPGSEVEAISTMAVTQTVGPHATPHLRFAPTLPLPDVGTTFGPYHLHRVLGRGGNGLVWDAEHRETHRRVAVKVVTAVRASSRDAVERFEREGRLAASINHPRCVFVFGAEEIGGYPAIAMELMAGGTLQDVIDRRGRIPTREAVDLILDVIEGLEAAQAAGVIHRDIKPSNCFVDAAGRAAIGDFGISKTLEANTDLTRAGTFVGTPAYAPPEQARGAEVDFRSDMYAVGATLYALLAGTPPFVGTSAADSLARVLTEPPPPLASHGVQAPKALETVIRRLLAKEPSRRYRDYAAVTAALLPFSSGAFTPATLAQRFAAFAVDYFIITTAATFLIALAMPFLLSWLLQDTPALEVATLINDAISRGRVVALLLYFVLTEWYWGRSLGKWLFGLRVTTTGGGPIALWQALLRPIVLMVPASLLRGAVTGLPAIVRDLVASAVELNPVLTMRPSNGFAGLHELLSGTRVVAVGARQRVRVPSVPLDADSSASGRLPPSPLRGFGAPGKAAPTAAAQRGFGPYRPLSIAWERDGQALLIARDDLLGRDVWIHAVDVASSAPPVAALIAGRPGQLRWLAGVREPAGSWDGYEAPTGSSLRAWIERRGRLSWRETKDVLSDVAAELLALESEPSSRRTISLDHIWVHGAGRAILLSMPVSVAHAEEPAFTVADWPSLLRRLTAFMLEGSDVGAAFRRPVNGNDDAAGAGHVAPRVPLPGHAREFIDELWGAHVRSPITRLETGVHSLAATREQLQALPLRADGLMRAARLAPLLAFAAVLTPVFVMAQFQMWGPSSRGPGDGPLERSTPEPIRDWGRYAGSWYSHERTASSLDASERAHLEAYRMLSSDTYARIEAQGLTGRLYLGDEARGWLEEARRRYPSPTADDIARARLAVESEARKPSMVEEGRRAAPAPAPPRGRQSLRTAMLSSRLSPFVLTYLVPALLLAFALRGGVLFWAFGISVQTRRGDPAGHFRSLARACVAWSPMVILAVVAIALEVTPDTVSAVVAAAALVFFAAGVYAVIRPERGLPDLIAGTHLMPK